MNQPSLKINWPIVFSGAVLGFLLSWNSLSGDEQGRVNLFHMLFVYMVIPIFSITLSLVSVAFGKGINLARILVAIPWWSRQFQNSFRNYRQFHIDKYWMLMQSQSAAIAFSLASLMTLFILLLSTDIHFIWRSTLLQANDIFPFLQWVAKPWHFWNSAQPDLSLVQLTQDSRLSESHIANMGLSGWWKFVFAVQIFYSLLLRILVLAIVRWWAIVKFKQDFETQLSARIITTESKLKKQISLAPILTELPGQLVLNNRALLPDIFLKQVVFPKMTDSEDAPVLQIFSGSNASLEQQQQAEKCQDLQLILVKAWEPPMGELEDFLEKGKGFIWPLDWENQTLNPLTKSDLEEWQRMIGHIENWQLYVAKEYLPQ